jgi:hypothetical protein
LSSDVDSYIPVSFDAQGVVAPGFCPPVENVNSYMNVPRYDKVHFSANPMCTSSKNFVSSTSAIVKDSGKYVQTVPSETAVEKKAEKVTSILAGVHGACRSEFAGADREDLASPTLTRSPPVCGPASAKGNGGSPRPSMQGTAKSMQTPPSKSTSIHTVIKHKGAVKNKVNKLNEMHFMNQQDRSLSFSNNTQGVCTLGENIMSQSFSFKQIVDFGGIKEEALQSVRSSERLRAQPNYDATQMERATMILQKRDEIPAIGTPKIQPNSLLSFSDEQIIQHANSLGVSLGNSHQENVISVNLMKEIELGRMLTVLEKNDKKTINNDFDSSCLIVSRASNLCEDLENEEDLLGDELNKVTPIIPKDKIRRKKSYDKKNVRRSNRIRVKTSKS